MTLANNGKAVLVTGAGRRIGAAIVRGLHGAGYRLIAHYHRSAGDAAALAAELNAIRPDSVRLLRTDLAETGKLADFVATAAGFWGALYGLINNASVYYPTPLGTVSESQWEGMLGTNLKAPFFLAQAAAPYLRHQAGCIVNITDIYAERPNRAHAVYHISKAGLAALTRALALELAPAVRVNGVAPGAILWPEQPMNDAEREKILGRIPLGRIGSPPDIAEAVLFLLESSPYVTGQILTVDGGRSLMI